VDRLARDVPAEFRDGIVAIDVSPKTVPHPVRGDVYTLGECVPLDWTGGGASLQSRIVLYHGSFQALARLGELDWREEAWETLSHELRHHLEWRADAAALEAYDWAAEQNFARHDGQPFDPAFPRSGERIAAGVYKVDDDVFIERAPRAAFRAKRVIAFGSFWAWAIVASRAVANQSTSSSARTSGGIARTTFIECPATWIRMRWSEKSGTTTSCEKIPRWARSSIRHVAERPGSPNSMPQKRPRPRTSLTTS